MAEEAKVDVVNVDVVDKEKAQQFLELLHGTDCEEVFEIRCLNAKLRGKTWGRPGVVWGFFNCPAKAAEALESLSEATGVYVTLNPVEPALIRESTSWLLTEAPDIDAVLRHPAVLTYDAQGRGWQVFDLDPTVRTLRHRALPVDDDLPEAMRRSEETGAPGYSGRKRGDIQFRRTDVQHSGSGMWVHAHLHRNVELRITVRMCRQLKCAAQHETTRKSAVPGAETAHFLVRSPYSDRSQAIRSGLFIQEGCGGDGILVSNAASPT